MKKTIKSLFAIAISAFALTACSDVPTPEGYNPDLGDGLVVYAPEGQGIVSSPYNVAGLKEAMKDLAKGSTTTNEVYATGYVAEIDNSEKNAFNPQYGNFTYYITDNEEGKSTKFYVYRGLGLGGDKFADANALKVGDKVTVYGKIQNYNGALQFSQGSKLAVLNDQTATNGGGGNIDPDMGTESKPFDVANAINAGEKTGVYIKGFIVGSAYSNQETKKTEWNLNATNPQASNILLAASASETDYTKCIPVALPSGSDVRTALNLKDNAGNLGKEVLLYGDLTKYFSQQGLKNTSYALLDGKAIGTKPGTTPTVQPSNFEAGQYFFILQVDGTYKEGIPVAAASSFGYITLKDATITDGKLAGTADNIFTFTKEGDGFTIQDATNRYYYMDDSHTSFQVSAEKPSTNYIWSINVGEDGKATITNIGRNKVVDYSTSYKTVSPGSNGGGLPMLLKQGAALDGGTSGGGDTGGGDTGGGDTGGTNMTKEVNEHIINFINGALTAAETPITVDFNQQGWENNTIPEAISLEDGTTIVVGKGEGSSDPKFYSATKGIRCYAKNTISITSTSKDIAKVIVTCDTYKQNGVLQNGNEQLYATAGNKNVTIVNDFTGTSGGVQLRVQKLDIYYAQ